MAVDKIAFHLYAHDIDGGPDNARNTVFVTVHHANKKLFAQGYKIEAVKSRGLRIVTLSAPR